MSDDEVVTGPADDLRSALAESLSETPSAAAESGATETPSSGERSRGADGKFIARDAGTPDDGSGEAAAEAASVGEGEPAREAEAKPKDDQAAAAAAPAGIDAPVHWSAADKEKFGALPADAKAPFLDLYKRMESGFTPKLQRGAQLERDYASVEQMFAPHAEGLRALGQTPADIIQAWGKVEQTLINARAAAEQGQASPAGAEVIARIIREYKVNPAEIAAVLTNGPQQQATTARTELPPEVAARLQRLESAEQQRIATLNTERVSGAQQQIETFANQKDSEGNLSHPFFSDVEPDMTALAQLDRAMGKTPDLSDLYDRAVYANRETRAKLLASAQEAEAKRAAVERKAKAEAAKRAAVSVTGSSGTGQTTTPPRGSGASVTDDLRASLEELRA